MLAVYLTSLLLFLSIKISFSFSEFLIIIWKTREQDLFTTRAFFLNVILHFCISSSGVAGFNKKNTHYTTSVFWRVMVWLQGISLCFSPKGLLESSEGGEEGGVPRKSMNVNIWMLVSSELRWVVQHKTKTLHGSSLDIFWDKCFEDLFWEKSSPYERTINWINNYWSLFYGCWNILLLIDNAGYSCSC